MKKKKIPGKETIETTLDIETNVRDISESELIEEPTTDEIVVKPEESVSEVTVVEDIASAKLTPREIEELMPDKSAAEVEIEKKKSIKLKKKKIPGKESIDSTFDIESKVRDSSQLELLEKPTTDEISVQLESDDKIIEDLDVDSGACLSHPVKYLFSTASVRSLTPEISGNHSNYYLKFFFSTQIVSYNYSHILFLNFQIPISFRPICFTNFLVLSSVQIIIICSFHKRI
jgi:hypothetical protein